VNKKERLEGGPLLRWAGSKRQLLPVLKDYYPATCPRYIEPFAGSACLFFHLDPPNAILGDINPELIRTYRTLQTSANEVAEYLKGVRRSRARYLELRSANIDSMSSPQRAARFIYLNRFCFNGLYRTDRAGRFNVPFGKSGTGQLPTAGKLLKASNSFARVQFVDGDFENCLTRAASGDFVYMDPPYAVSSRRVFNDYCPTSFSENDLKRLHKWMHKLDATGVRFVVSYAYCPEARKLGNGFSMRRVRVRRNIAGFVSDRHGSYELLISNCESRQWRN
jgi:DNA adenine methylase